MSEHGGKPNKPLYAKRGYYVYNNILSGPNVDVVYTTGMRGGGGHCYYRIMQGIVPNPAHTMGGYKNGWTTLLWTCVPGKSRIGNYTYYSTCPKQIQDWR